ncbi:MAG: ribosomal-protein-alanine N-acetyltransferase [Firmicutes bacterium HGW-Firmicutes-14]|nr:MAG: ribosomal-protein-alanine N-acetyltransferase [Firmicutes bacterium HGW-Firmicutes-14]
MKSIHLDGVLEIENQSFPTPWSRTAFFHEITGNDFAYYIVALADGQVAGYAGMWVILDEGHITTVAVHPAYRRQKVGSRLLSELINESRKRGCIKMTLEVRPSNANARKMYEKAGFVSYGIRPGYYSDTGEDALIMWNDLYRGS